MEFVLKRVEIRQKRIVISDIRDMEERAASAALVKALASRVQRVLRELGLTAIVRVGRNPDIPHRRPRKARHGGQFSTKARTRASPSRPIQTSETVLRPRPAMRTRVEETRQ
jgi:hypothetical protein